VRKLLIFLVVVSLLVVGVDIGARAFAETKAGEAIAAQTGTATPSVDIHGFSFLVQALPGHYQNITLTSQDIAAGPITGIAATIDLYDVDFPLSDALKGDTTHLHAAQVRLHGEIPTSRLSAVMTQAGVRVTAGPGGAIRVGTTISALGKQIPVSADLIPSFSSGTLHLDATNLTAAAISVSSIAGPRLNDLTKNLSLALPLKDLPFTVAAATLTASGDHLVLLATANDVGITAKS
jgi:hypothetical protein